MAHAMGSDGTWVLCRFGVFRFPSARSSVLPVLPGSYGHVSFVAESDTRAWGGQMRQQHGCWRLARGTSRTCAGWHVRPGGVPGEHSGDADISASSRAQCCSSRLRRGPPSFRSQPPPGKRPCRVAGRLAASSAILSFLLPQAGDVGRAVGWSARDPAGAPVGNAVPRGHVAGNIF